MTPRLADDPAGWARPRARLVGTALVAGLLLGAAATVVLPAAVAPRQVRATTFAVGALLLGFGVLGWSGSVMAGRGIENAQRFMETGTDWTEADSRRAMGRIAGFGAGLMVGESLAAAAV